MNKKDFYSEIKLYICINYYLYAVKALIFLNTYSDIEKVLIFFIPKFHD